MYKTIMISFALSFSLFANDDLSKNDQMMAVDQTAKSGFAEIMKSLADKEMKLIDREKNSAVTTDEIKEEILSIQVLPLNVKMDIEIEYNPKADNGGKIIGNGGKGFVCPSEDGIRVYLLDYIQASHVWSMYIIPGDGADEYEKAKSLVERISRFDPVRAQVYAFLIDDFKKTRHMVNQYQFTYIDDSKEFATPDECEAKVIVNQKKPRFSEDRRYRVNQDLWDLLSVDDRAGLIVHEIIYREALMLGQETAHNVVYFNAIIGGKIFEIDKKQYQNILSLIGFPTYVFRSND